MPARKHKASSLDRVLGRLESLDAVNLTNLVQRLARERRLFEAVFNTIREGILVITPGGRIEYANDAALGLIGIEGGDPGGATLWRLVPGLRQTVDLAAHPPGGSAPLVSRELEIQYPQPRCVRIHLVPFEEAVPPAEEAGGAGGRRYVVILVDITQERRSTEERIENEKTSSIWLLAAGVAHELGNPLNSLNIHLQLMDRRLRRLKAAKGAAAARTADALAESAAVCQAEVARLDGIIRNFLEAIRPQAPDFSETSLAEVLEEVLRFEAGRLDDRNVTVEVESVADLPVVLADRNQIKQVFFNILRNAMDAMEPGGRLKIRLRADDDSVYVHFADSGSGIRQEDLSRLFQPYFTTKKGGHGLGLMIVNRIMREHGGHVGIDSKEGVGTVVTLQFPPRNRRIRMLGR